MKPPRLTGKALIAARVAAENPATSALLRDVLKASLGLDRLAALPTSARGEWPMTQVPIQARAPRELPHAGLGTHERKVWPRSHEELRAAMAAGRTDPAALAERALGIVTSLARNRVLNVLVASDEARTRREAAASATRHRAGRTLGPLDGIPYLVKDEVDVAGLPTRIGTRCESEAPKPTDATIVARLAQAGAVFAGKTVMTEWGMSPLGQNCHYRMPTNAHHAERVPGGSSSGSAVGVAMGAVPFAIGTDGGGSVRIPAALNGVFSIKPTFGRVSRTGSLSGSVGHVGPIGASPSDLAAFLDAVASEVDPAEPLSTFAAPPPKGGFGSRLGAGVKGLRIGVPESEWADASPEVAERCRAALAALEKEGAQLVQVSMPLAAVAAPLGYITIGCEVFAAKAHFWREARESLADDLRLSFAVLSGLSAAEFGDAQLIRSSLRQETARVLAEVDLIAMPTTVTTAPELSVHDRGKAFADTVAIDAMCRFNFLGNLTGLPAATAPVGVGAHNLPIGLQLIGDAWDEAGVLGALAHLERVGAASVEKPKAALDLLDGV